MAASTARPGLRRRLDNWSLRMQARLDTDWVDRTLPWIVVAVLFAAFLAMALAVVRQVDGGPGLALWRNTAWNFQVGNGTVSGFTGEDLLREQWAWLAYPAVWLTEWLPTAQVLAVAQAGALALGVIPLWRLSRDVFDLRLGTTGAVVAAYALAPAVHAANLSFFRPEVVAVPALAWGIVSWRKAHWVRFGVAMTLVLLCRADMGVTVAAVGVLLLIDGERRRGAVTALVGLLYTGLAIVLLDPRLPEGPLTAAEAVAARGTAPLAEVRALFVDPATLLADLTSQRSLPVIIALFAPLLFLPFTAPRTLIPAVPPLLFGIAAAEAVSGASEPGTGGGAPGAANVLVAVVPITVAGLVALNRIGRRSITRVNVDHRIVAAIVVASSIFFVQSAPTSPYQQPWGWGSRDEVDRARLRAVALVGPDWSLLVSPQLGAEVAERAVISETWLGPPAADGEPWEPEADAVLLDTTGVDAQDVPLWTDEDRLRVIALLVSQGYELRYRDLGILLLRSG